MDGTSREDIDKNQRVNVVKKRQLTEYIFSGMLMYCLLYPHGLKIRLESEEVGRVKEILKIF